MEEAIVGEMAGTQLKIVPSRMVSFERFQRRRPDGTILTPNNPDLSAYSRDPYVSYYRARVPFLYWGESPDGRSPLVRIVAIGDKAYALDLLRPREGIMDGKLMLTWESDQNSVLDASLIEEGLYVGKVVVQESGPHGRLDGAHDVTFAFLFHGFISYGEIFVQCADGKEVAKSLVCR